MARVSVEGTQSCLGFAVPKNPDQGITAIAAGFWKMLPVVIFMRRAMERASTDSAGMSSDLGRQPYVDRQSHHRGLTAGVKTMGGKGDPSSDVEGRRATGDPRETRKKRVALVTGAASGLGRAI